MAGGIMTTKVTKESLAEKIKYLESVSKLGLSLNEEYQLKAYRLLLDFMRHEDYLNDLREEYNQGRL